MIKKLLIFLFFIIFGLVNAEFSFSSPPVKEKKGEKIREFDFEGDVVEAEFLRPEEATIEAVARAKKKSLIFIRYDFVDEILKSSEDL